VLSDETSERRDGLVARKTLFSGECPAAMPILPEKGLFQKIYIPPPKTQGKEYFSGQTFIPGTFLRVNFDDPKTRHTQGLRVLFPIFVSRNAVAFFRPFSKNPGAITIFQAFYSPST
jgi:hypothetical protein